jgi:hypothetical protein
MKEKNTFKIVLKDNEETRHIVKKHAPKWWNFSGHGELHDALRDMYEYLLRDMGAGKVVCPWMKEGEEIEMNLNVNIPVIIKKNHE